MKTKRAPFGWPTRRLDPGGTISLPGTRDAAPETAGWFRFTTSIDDREIKTISVSLAASGRCLGEIELRYAHSLEPFQLPLAAADFAAASREGLTLNLVAGEYPLWILGQNLPAGAAPLEPGLVPENSNSSPIDSFFRLLGSVASVQTFGWMEGCVLDALHDLFASTADARWKQALEAHFELFITPEGQLVYENPSGQPADGRIYGIEGTLPFAQLAKIQPDHPLLEFVLEYFAKTLAPDGNFTAPHMISAEGSYTIAYPLAVIAQLRGDASLAALSANVLRVRLASLHRPDGLWLRHYPDGTRTFRSWARGVAWYLLGLGRSLEHLDGLTDTADLRTGFRTAAEWAMGLQRADGLWGCFLDETETLYDTSGSAGIAAALARGTSAGLLSSGAADAAEQCWRGLMSHLTSDGFLDGAAQSNRGGEELQRSTYRVLSPMGMGLMGQLAAALNHSPSSTRLASNPNKV